MRPSINLALLLFFIIGNCTDTLAQDLNSYRESFKSNNYYDIVEKADKFWDLHTENKQEYREEYKNYMRWKSFASTRFGDNGDLSAYPVAISEYYRNNQYQGSRMKAAAYDMFFYLGPVGIPPTPGYGDYSSTGKGWINCLYVDTADNDIIFAGTHNSGLWKTTDGGDSWTHLTKDYPLISGIFSIVFNPNNKDEFFVLTGVDFSGHYSAYTHGIFKTTNGGTSWNEVPVVINDTAWYPRWTDPKKFPQKLVMNPTYTSNLFLLTSSYILESTDFGSTWSISYDGSSTGANLVDIEFSISGSYFDMYASGNIILGYYDYADVWYDITSSITGRNNVDRTEIGIHENYPGVTWFYYDTSSVKGEDEKFLVKYSGGSSKLLHHEELDGTQTMNIAVSPNDSGIVYLGAIGFYKYKNSPADFVLIRGSLGDESKRYGPYRWLHVDIRDIVVIDQDTIDKVFVGYDGGVSWATDDTLCGSTYYCWNQISDDSTSGLQITEFYGLAGVESDPDLLFGGCQDLSSFIYNDGEWKHALAGDVGKTLIDFSNPEHFYYVGTTSRIPGNVKRLDNYGMSDGPELISDLKGKLWNPLVFNPLDPTTIFVGDNGLRRIRNADTSIFLIDTITPDPVKGDITAIGISPADTSTIYCATVKISWDPDDDSDSIFFKSTDGGSNWTDTIGIDLNACNWSFITDIIVNPNNEDELWVCFGMAIGNTTKVYHSDDGGDTWTNLATGYPPSIPAHCIEYDDISGLLYVGTDVGLFIWDTGDENSEWKQFDDNLNRIISEIVINKTYRKLRISTYGYGIWESIRLPLCYEIGSDQYITSNQTWSDTRIVCSDIIIDGATLTITGSVTMDYSTTIRVEDSSTLTVSGGLIKNAYIVVEEGGTLNIENNGEIILDHEDHFIIDVGGILNLDYGIIDVNPE